ncbi:uncharacterized, partial [Tachysurus ichikawai]
LQSDSSKHQRVRLLSITTEPHFTPQTLIQSLPLNSYDTL